MLREKGVADSIFIQVVQSQESRHKRQEEEIKGPKFINIGLELIMSNFRPPLTRLPNPPKFRWSSFSC